jgi:formate C-acetyltransferase
MFIHAHRAQNLIYPKVHYRFSSESPEEYLQAIAVDYVNGRSVGGLANDDAIIPFMTNGGTPPEIARSYVNYGCWGFTIEGIANSAGGSFVHLLGMLEHTVYGTSDSCREIGLLFDPIDDAKSFDEVFDIFYGNVIRALRYRVALLVGKQPQIPAQVNPIPIFTSLMEGAIEWKHDYPRARGLGFNLAEIANVVDALLAIKHICFVRKEMTVREFLDIVRSNWEGHEALRQRLRKLPHYGDESDESMELANRIVEGVKVDASGDGRWCGISLLIYQEYRFDATGIRATPDGRKNGDVVALGVNPTRLHPTSIPATINSATTFDPHTVATFSLNLQMPSTNMTVEQMVSLMRVAGQLKMKHIQINCVDEETLRDAQKHPEKHQDLVVRVVGFSAKFVSLSPEWQEEFIRRVFSRE